MAKARIFQRPKNAMQSGRYRIDPWTLEFEPAEAKHADPLTGWAGSGDTNEQVRLGFATAEDAIAYAEKNALPYDLERPQKRQVKPKAYADNFRFGRMENWTH